MTRGTGGEGTRPPAVLGPLVCATPGLDRTVAEVAEPAASGVHWPGAPFTAGAAGLAAVLEGRRGRVASGRGAVAV
ncbi:hypothetical protein [Streptomyces sp. NPDC048637]|uniref:hypothetical protein n=1 Tax=Streptomyces sp. NPDC048637 TaxID=3155636 RepID=UPI003442298A